MVKISKIIFLIFHLFTFWYFFLSWVVFVLHVWQLLIPHAHLILINWIEIRLWKMCQILSSHIGKVAYNFRCYGNILKTYFSFTVRLQHLCVASIESICLNWMLSLVLLAFILTSFYFWFMSCKINIIEKKYLPDLLVNPGKVEKCSF